MFGSPQSKYELVLQRVIRWFIEGSLSRIIFLLVNETTKVPSLRTVTSLQITGNQFRQDYFQSDQNLSTVFLFFLFLTFFLFSICRTQTAEQGESLINSFTEDDDCDEISRDGLRT